MAIENPDHPWAAGPPVTMDDDEVTLPTALWSATLREMDPVPVSTMVYEVRRQLSLIAAELERFDEITPDYEAEWVSDLQDMVTQVTKATQEKPRGREDIPGELLAAVIAYLKEGDEPPDRSVGIWGNGWGELAHELALAREGKLTCPRCGGDTYTWDEGVFLEKTAEIAKQTGEDVDELRQGGQDWGNVVCAKCEGAGVVRIEDQP